MRQEDTEDSLRRAQPSRAQKTDDRRQIADCFLSSVI
jgi:hypothetical protein